MEEKNNKIMTARMVNRDDNGVKKTFVEEKIRKIPANLRKDVVRLCPQIKSRQHGPHGTMLHGFIRTYPMLRSCPVITLTENEQVFILIYAKRY